jgi:hypothetical protein
VCPCPSSLSSSLKSFPSFILKPDHPSELENVCISSSLVFDFEVRESFASLNHAKKLLYEI